MEIAIQSDGIFVKICRMVNFEPEEKKKISFNRTLLESK